MRRSLDVCLWDVRKELLLLQGFVAGSTLEQFRADDLSRAATERKITTVGEALVRVREHFPLEFDRIAGGLEFVRFRNRLVHLYDLMDADEVWNTTNNQAPSLLAQIEAMLAELDH